MGTVTRSSSEVYTSDSEKGFAMNHSTSTSPELDAGAKFVLVSRGEAAFPFYSIMVVMNRSKSKNSLCFFLLFHQDEKKGVCVDELFTIRRIMVALWVPFDYIYCGSGASYSSFLLHFVGLGWRSALVDPCSSYHILFIQPFICGLGISCTAWSAPASIQGHG